MVTRLDQFVDEDEFEPAHDALDHSGLAGAIAEAHDGTNVLPGPFKQIKFPAGGVTDAGGGVLEVSATGPQGPQGIQGNTGPAGPGFSTISAFQESADVFTNPAGSSSVTFTFGFNVKGFGWGFSRIQLFGGSDGVRITNITVSGTQVTIFYTTSDSPSAGLADLQVRFGCVAFG